MPYDKFKNVEIDENETEKEDDIENDDLFNISFYGVDFTVRELVEMFKDNDLIKPKLQRNYVWERVEASRFIESLLLGLPVPGIFFAARPDKKYLIVDGYQRIRTLYDYIIGNNFSDEDTIFSLSNTKKINERWRGKRFSVLEEEDKRHIKTSVIHTIIFQQKYPKDDSGMYQIFERINTGGRTLYPQEIRNCIYQGNFNDFLTDLNKIDAWRKLFGSDIEDTRMKDKEMILRFFAMNAIDFYNMKNKSISLKSTLNDYMKANKDLTKDFQEKYKILFDKTMNFILNNIGQNAFQNISKDNIPTGKFHPTIFDAISLATVSVIDDQEFKNPDDLKDRFKLLLTDESFIESITQRTTNTDNIIKRISVAKNILYTK